MCNVVLKDYEVRFFERNLDAYPRNVCGRCWDETREKVSQKLFQQVYYPYEREC